MEQLQEVKWCTAHRLYRTSEITHYLDIITTISWLSGFKQLAQPVDYGHLNAGASVPESMTGWLVNLCQICVSHPQVRYDWYSADFYSWRSAGDSQSVGIQELGKKKKDIHKCYQSHGRSMRAFTLIFSFNSGTCKSVRRHLLANFVCACRHSVHYFPKVELWLKGKWGQGVQRRYVSCLLNELFTVPGSPSRFNNMLVGMLESSSWTQLVVFFKVDILSKK